MDRRFSRNCTSSSSSRTSPDSLLERDVLDAEHLGSLGAVKGVHVLEALVVGVELADGDVGRVGEALVQDLSTCQSVTRAGARKTHIAVVLSGKGALAGDESLSRRFGHVKRADVSERDCAHHQHSLGHRWRIGLQE
jgi:hypothetical protein